ncbi:MAG: DUF4173 domain-containing protein [Eubacteriales bacterium]|nr:DUF4173 domain-containing protein [Eubacteriales bacterium]
MNSKFTRTDLGFAAVMLVCGFLYWNLISIDSLGAGVSIFAVIFCIVISIYLKLSGIHQTRGSIICLVVVALSAANFPLYDNIMIKGLNFIFLSVSVVYYICVLTKKRTEDKLTIFFIGDMINQLLIVPFYNFNCCFLGLKNGMIKNRHSKGLISALAGIVIFLPVLILVTNLLTDADAAFESMINSIHFSLSANMIEYIIQVILGIPVACYLFGLVYGNRYNRHTNHITLESINKNAAAFRFAPSITVYSALAVLNGIYMLFFISQASYLFSAFGNHIPGVMTYSEYARRGFFELCMVAGINLGVIIIAHLITSRGEKTGTPKMLKIETVALCFFTIMLIGTALSKMAMYIKYFGLTQLRVYTTWFMLVLLLVFVIIALRQFKIFNGSKIVIISFVILFMFLCYGNVDGMIAKYNINRYVDGTLKTVDVNALARLSDGAVPYMFQLYKDTDDENLKNNLKSVIIDQEDRERTFRDFNLQKYKGNQIRATIR